MKYVLGIDQGASKTHVIVADENGSILGMGKSYGACHSSHGMDYAMGAILEATDMALKPGGLKHSQISTVVGGLTGVDWEYEADLLRDALRVHFETADIEVVNDCIIAMRGGTQKDTCGILCAGSGLNCAVLHGDECFVYGFYIPDECQGGFALGRSTVQAVFDAHMGLVEKTILGKMVLDYFKDDSVDQLLYRQVKGRITDKDYLHLPILLEEAALRGDITAQNIWKDYGTRIARYLTARMRLMGILNVDTDIVLSGSIFKCKYPAFIDAVKKEIGKAAKSAKIMEAKYEPVVGAVRMAIQRCTGRLSDTVEENLLRFSKDFPILRC